MTDVCRCADRERNWIKSTVPNREVFTHTQARTRTHTHTPYAKMRRRIKWFHLSQAVNQWMMQIFLSLTTFRVSWLSGRMTKSLKSQPEKPKHTQEIMWKNRLWTKQWQAGIIATRRCVCDATRAPLLSQWIQSNQQHQHCVTGGSSLLNLSVFFCHSSQVALLSREHL